MAARSNIVRDPHKGSPGIGINFYALICTVAAAFIVPRHLTAPPLPTKFVRIMRDARAPRGQLVHSSNLVGKCRALATVPLIIPRRYPRRRRNRSFAICFCILRARNRVIARPRFSFHHLFVWRHVRLDAKETEREREGEGGWIFEILETSSEARGIIIDAETRWLHSLIRWANIEDEDGLNNLPVSRAIGSIEGGKRFETGSN